MPFITREKPNLKDCYIYHTIDLPGGETLNGDWDLRALGSTYTGEVDFSGATVLDVGTATGFLSFYAESKGAKSVTSFDMEDGGHFDILPWKENDQDAVASANSEGIERLKNGYWYCHHRLNSKAKAFYGDIYHIPPETGSYDVVILGSVLLHTQNPFGVIASAAARASNYIVVTDLDSSGQDNAVFAPNFAGSNLRDPNDLCSWWSLPHKTVMRMLSVIGFREVRCLHFTAYSETMKYTTRLYSLVASR